MSRRLLTEIDKALKETRNTLELYDSRWSQLRRFNSTQVGVKERMWEESRREQMRGKKHAVRTATLELLDFKHVCDSKSKMEADMESLLRRLHRYRQQLTEWLGLGDLRTQFDELKDLRKQIELRYKRGRVFYCLGQSSEDVEDGSNQLGGSTDWISDFIDKLKRQADLWEADVEDVTRKIAELQTRAKTPPTKGKKQPGGNALCSDLIDKKAQLEAFVDLHKMHIRKLEDTNTNKVGDNLNQLSDSIVEEIQEPLKQYIEFNDDLTIVVADEIYNDVDVPICDSDNPASEQESPLSATNIAVDSPTDATSTGRVTEAQSPKEGLRSLLPSGRANEEQSAVKAQSTSAWHTRSISFREPTPTELVDVQLRATSCQEVEASGELLKEATVDDSANDLQERVICKDAAKEIDRVGSSVEFAAASNHMVIVEDKASCDWVFEGRGAVSDAITSRKTLQVKKNDKLYIIKVDESGWTFAFIHNPGAVENPLIIAKNGMRYISPDASKLLSAGWLPDSVRQSIRASRKLRNRETSSPAALPKVKEEKSTTSSDHQHPRGLTSQKIAAHPTAANPSVSTLAVSIWDVHGGNGVDDYSDSREPTLLQRLRIDGADLGPVKKRESIFAPGCPPAFQQFTEMVEAATWWWSTLLEEIYATPIVLVVKWAWSGELITHHSCACENDFKDSFLDCHDLELASPLAMTNNNSTHKLLFVSKGDRVLVQSTSGDRRWAYGQAAEREHKKRSGGDGMAACDRTQLEDDALGQAVNSNPVGQLIEDFSAQFRAFLESQPIHECLPESSKLLLLDHKVTFSVAVNALNQYKRPFGCVFAPSIPEFTYILDGFDVLAFFIHVIKYFTERRYLFQLHEALSSILQGVSVFTDIFSFDTSESITPEHRETLSRDLDRALRLLPSTFSLQELETATQYEGVRYLTLLNPSSSVTKDKGGDVTPSTAAVAVDDMDSSCSIADYEQDGPNGEALRRRIEFVFPAPWDYNLEWWHKLNGRAAPFPHLSLRQHALAAAELLIDSGRSRIIAWDDVRGAPFSFLTLTSLLGHVVQHFRANSPVLDMTVLHDLELGVPMESLIVVHSSARLINALELMRNNHWSCVPLVESDGTFLGLLSVSHVLHLLLRALSDPDVEWRWDDTMDKIWRVLVNCGAAHARTIQHTYQKAPTPTASSRRGSLKAAENNPSHRITSKFGGAFLAKLGDMTSKQTCEPDTSIPESPLAPTPAAAELHDLPRNVARAPAFSPLEPTTDEAAPSPVRGIDNVVVHADTSNATNAVQALVKNLTCSALIIDTDITLRQMIAHLVLTDDRRVLFIDRGRIRGYITPAQVFKLLLNKPSATEGPDVCTQK